MKRMIVLYSKTGNTLNVGNLLRETLKCDLKEVKAQSDDPNIQSPVLVQIPDITSYDHVILGTPVHSFLPSKVMSAYLNQLPDLKGKTIDLFVTHLFPFNWMGGYTALKQMKKIIEGKQGVVRKTSIVSYSKKRKDKHIGLLLDRYQDEKAN